MCFDVTGETSAAIMEKQHNYSLINAYMTSNLYLCIYQYYNQHRRNFFTIHSFLEATRSAQTSFKLKETDYISMN